MIHIHHSPDNQTLIFLRLNRQNTYTLSLSTLDSLKDSDAVTLIPNGKVQGKPKREGQVNFVTRDKESGQMEALLAANEEVVCYFDVA